MLRKLSARFLKDESGATAIEYGLIVAILGLGIAIAMTNFRDSIWTLYNDIKDNLVL